ncbi:MAG: D-aminoacylase [Clostridia bacterium]|nr:D-aminoacylase [Clostridia bacterium]
MFDLLIKNGRIIDGTGSPSYLADVAVKDGKIVKVKKGIKGDAARVIDASGRVVTPGFIDSHGHSDRTLLTYPEQIEKVEQGITTTLSGQCGGSVAPIAKYVTASKQVGEFGDQQVVYKTMGTLINIAKDRPLGSNMALLVGHGQLRRAVMGLDNRAPTEQEMEEMKALLRDALEHGALGMSFGLFYAPGCYAETDECIELAKVVKEYEGVLAAHMREEADYLIRSVKEYLSIIRASGCRGVISHHKSYQKEENWGKVNHSLRMIDEANAEGLDVYCDVYPFVASQTNMLSMFIPRLDRAMGNEKLTQLLRTPEYREKVRKINIDHYGKDDLKWVQVTACPDHPEYSGMLISDIAKERGQEDYEAMFDVMCDCKMNCSACFFTMCEEDVETVMSHPRAMICTDSDVAAESIFFHPRLSASFTRVLGRYVRERGVTSLPEMIRKMTAMPAAVYGFKSKGLVWDGFDADLCIFDPDTIIDNASFDDCRAKATGLDYVIVGGQVAAENATYTGAMGGKLLLRGE